MLSPFDTFTKTLKIGAALLSISYSNYQDAYDYSKQYHSTVSDHMVDFFVNHSDAEPGEYEYNLCRYIFIKAMEQRISSDLFSNTERGNVCDIFHSPFDIGLDSYPTNLPKHIEDAVNDYQREGHVLAQLIMKELSADSEYVFGSEILNALQFLGQTVGYHIGQEKRVYKSYDCSSMLTRNELNEIAGHNLCNWLVRNGFEIEEANFSRDTYQNIVASNDSNRIFILVSAEITPVDPGFIPLDLDNLYKAAIDAGAMPYYASVSLGSADEQHFSDGIIMYGDDVRFRINAFAELETE